MNTCCKLLSVLATCFCIIAAKQKYLQVPIVQAILLGLGSKSFSCPGYERGPGIDCGDYLVEIVCSCWACKGTSWLQGGVKGSTCLPFQAARVALTAQVFPNLVTAQCV